MSNPRIEKTPSGQKVAGENSGASAEIPKEGNGAGALQGSKRPVEVLPFSPSVVLGSEEVHSKFSIGYFDFWATRGSWSHPETCKWQIFFSHVPQKGEWRVSVSLIAALNKSQPEAQRHILKPVTAFATQIYTFLYMKMTCKGKTVNLRQHEKLQHPLQAFKEMLHYRVGRKGLYTFPWFIFNYF